MLRLVSRVHGGLPNSRGVRSPSCLRFISQEGKEQKKEEKPASVTSIKKVAQDCSFVRGLYFGQVNNRAFPFPSTLTPDQRETLNMLVDPVNKFFSERVDSKKIDETKEIPPQVLEELKHMGLFGLQIPEKFGGLGLSNTAYARVVEEIVTDASLAVTIMAHQSIGLKGILLNGNQAQKEKYLPKLATGEHVAAFALTEPSSGSDAASIRTKATLSADGKHWILNGGKIWISNGGIAEIMTVFAKTQLPGDEHERITAFIVERSFGGVTSGVPEDKLGIRGSNTCEVHFENTPVPIENVLDNVGNGFKVAMNILNNGRFGLGAGSGGAIKKLIGHIAEHATTRKQFGHPLSNFDLIKEKFANMALDAYAIESMAYMTTGMIDRGDPSCEVEAAICKVFGSEAAWRAVNEAIQVMGGSGFMKSYPYERIMRDTRILSIFEGTNEILRMLIALTGIRGVGDRLKSLMKNPFAHPTVAVDEITRIFFGKIWKPDPIEGIHASLRAEGEKYSDDVFLFGDGVNSLLRAYGKNIIAQQIQLRRVADITMDLYATAAVLSRASKALSESSTTAEHEKTLAQTFAKLASARVHSNLQGIASNMSKSGLDLQMKKIATDIFEHKKYIPPHPTGVNTH